LRVGIHFGGQPQNATDSQILTNSSHVVFPMCHTSPNKLQVHSVASGRSHLMANQLEQLYSLLATARGIFHLLPRKHIDIGQTNSQKIHLSLVMCLLIARCQLQRLYVAMCQPKAGYSACRSGQVLPTEIASIS